MDIERLRGSTNRAVGADHWNAWIAFSATGVEVAADTTHRRVDGLLTWREGALLRVREARASGLAERLAADLIGLPLLRASQVANHYGVTHQAAMNALRRLEHLGLLTAETAHGRVTFKTDDVVQLLEQ
jgi:hypothetical protein